MIGRPESGTAGLVKTHRSFSRMLNGFLVLEPHVIPQGSLPPMARLRSVVPVEKWPILQELVLASGAKIVSASEELIVKGAHVPWQT